MEVYLLSSYIDYEGTREIAVFESKEMAEQKKDECEKWLKEKPEGPNRDAEDGLWDRFWDDRDAYDKQAPIDKCSQMDDGYCVTTIEYITTTPQPENDDGHQQTPDTETSL